MRHAVAVWSASALVPVLLASGPRAASPPRDLGDAPAQPRAVGVVTEAQLRAAWSDPTRRRIDLGADIVLRNCHLGDPIRESPYPLVLDGHGHTIRQSCFEKRLLRQDGTGYLDLRDVTLTRGGSDGPGGALTSRGEIMLSDCVIKQNLAEEPGGGVYSMRRVTVHRCRINGNLANDDGGGIYARRGGVQVYDSVLSTNLVDGSGGAIGSTGDILVVRSQVDGNTTDGDGGALYADEDGDVTVVDSFVDGSDADGPGGAIFALDGDVAVLRSSLIGNRADDRGGAISGEADVLVVSSTIARNLAVAHAGGGIWARGNLTLVNATVTDNYAEGAGGGVLTAGRTLVISSTITRNIASVGGDLASSGALSSFASVIGPPVTQGVTGDTIPTRRSCRVYASVSLGHNFVTDDTCGLLTSTDLQGDDPLVARLEDDPRGFVLLPVDGSPLRGRIPSGTCAVTLPGGPESLPAAQLLEQWVDWSEVLTRDARGSLRDTGASCDIGAVQSEPVVAPPPGPAPGSLAGPPPSRPRGTESDSAAGRRSDRTDPRRPRGRPGGVAGALRHQAERLARLRAHARRFDVLLACTSQAGFDRVGDQQHRWGFLYDERDGTGLDMRPALARHRGAGPPDWRLLRLATSRRCLSRAPDPNGSGDDARATVRIGVGGLLRRLHRLERIAGRVEDTVGRFDAWESCLRWLPITQAGDPEQDLGYLTRTGRHAAALDLDHSEYDDPDYQVLALGPRDRPFSDRPFSDRPFSDRPCGRDPGEAADRGQGGGPGGRGRLAELRAGVAALREDLDDLVEPVGEITRFDECLYTLGAREEGGYRYRGRRGGTSVRSALRLDLRGASLPQMSLLAFPGEEPPQIECNEDAGSAESDD